MKHHTCSIPAAAGRLASKLLPRVPAVALVLMGFFGCAAEEEEPLDPDEYDLSVASAGVDCKETVEQAYDRGKPTTIRVIHIGRKAIAKPTGHAFLKMQAAAKKAGVSLGLVSGFRRMAEQERLYNCYRTKSCNNGNLAARPGYSNHQNGLAVDVTTSAWLAANAPKFGFVRTVPSEPWHWEYRGKDPGGPCTRGGEETTPPPAPTTGAAAASPARDGEPTSPGGRDAGTTSATDAGTTTSSRDAATTAPSRDAGTTSSTTNHDAGQLIEVVDPGSSRAGTSSQPGASSRDAGSTADESEAEPQERRRDGAEDQEDDAREEDEGDPDGRDEQEEAPTESAAAACSAAGRPAEGPHAVGAVAALLAAAAAGRRRRRVAE